jgi:hypothetical protein
MGIPEIPPCRSVVCGHPSPPPQWSAHSAVAVSTRNNFAQHRACVGVRVIARSFVRSCVTCSLGGVGLCVCKQAPLRSLGPCTPSPKAILPALIRLCDLRHGDTVYDLGSGDGLLLMGLAKARSVTAGTCQTCTWLPLPLPTAPACLWCCPHQQLRRCPPPLLCLCLCAAWAWAWAWATSWLRGKPGVRGPVPGEPAVRARGRGGAGPREPDHRAEYGPA